MGVETGAGADCVDVAAEGTETGVAFARLARVSGKIAWVSSMGSILILFAAGASDSSDAGLFVGEVAIGRFGGFIAG